MAVASIGVMGGALWAISQTQLASLKELVTSQYDAVDSKLRLVQDSAKQVDERLAAELSRRETEIKSQLKVIQDELDRRRHDFLSEKEFTQFQGRIIAELVVIKEQLKVLEQTRPTTGELQATSQALRDRIDKLYIQITSIDEYLRAAKQK